MHAWNVYLSCCVSTVLTLFSLFLPRCCSKECLVTSSGIDNTENGLSGSKADSKPKPTPKKKWENARVENLRSSYLYTFLFAYAHVFGEMQIHSGCGNIQYVKVWYHMGTVCRGCMSKEGANYEHTQLFKMCTIFNHVDLRDRFYQRHPACVRFVKLIV